MIELTYEGIRFDPRGRGIKLMDSVGAYTLYEIAREAFLTSNLVDVRFPFAIVPAILVQEGEQERAVVVCEWSVHGGNVATEEHDGVEYRFVSLGPTVVTLSENPS